VGDNRYIVPHARDRLIAFGPEALPYLSEEFDSTASSLALRAFNYILRELIEQDREGVIDILQANLASTEEIRRRIALAEISELNADELEDMVAVILDEPDPGMQRRAISTLGALESHVADDRLLGNLNPASEEALIKVSMETLFSLDVYCYDRLRPLLDYPYISMRETLIGKLVENIEAYDHDLREALFFETGLSPVGYIPPPLSTRALRSILKVYATAELGPDERLTGPILVLLDHEDWGVRADAVLVVWHWQALADEELARGGDPSYAMLMYELIEPLVEQADEMLETETDPYVLFVGSLSK